ncbi:hypothetical protein [Minwuia sp.]|uniref:hypothetical protein n=1 Tax=Minwuia sp. TaxID=2493630 RepID=UPI003A8FE146
MSSQDELLESLKRQRREGDRIRAVVNKSANSHFRTLLRDSQNGRLRPSQKATKQKMSGKGVG